MPANVVLFATEKLKLCGIVIRLKKPGAYFIRLQDSIQKKFKKDLSVKFLYLVINLSVFGEISE
jgi:hypothetical protein